ncbi:hypothetical protein LuPra_00116 [Luteitalea pratensis]|uniref:Uncharacterized protein n=2 Tax=Luteitalea pratensis TaxID=1855912 RepID=A0A143PEF1_LUTPR|nr:hypothetical protein LuPra_00116 [Luteitalea pratensis]
MRTFGLLIGLLVATPLAPTDQSPLVPRDTISDQDVPDHGDNINARYIVEHADIRGVPEDDLTEALQDDLRGLIGQRLDSGAADRLQERMVREFPDYDVSRRIERGNESAASGSSTRLTGKRGINSMYHPGHPHAHADVLSSSGCDHDGLSASAA